MENVSPPKFSGSIVEDEASVTDKVLAAMRGAASPRLREVMAALVRHLHAFAREVRLTEEEFETGIDFLNRIGQATHDAHNEGILFSDAVGLSRPSFASSTMAATERPKLLPRFSVRSGA
jgi:hypothetical protein